MSHGIKYNEANTKISIIVAAYNIAEWLPRCIQSIFAQTHQKWELILIDDGSTDDTGMIIDSYAQKDDRIIAIHQKNKGLVEVREKGIELATGEYIGFIDGDDAVEPEMYERLLHNALLYEADISHCGLVFISSGEPQKHTMGSETVRIQNSLEAVRDLLSGEWMEPSLCNKIYKRSLLKDSCLNKTIIYNEDFLRNFVLFQRANIIVYQDFGGYRYYKRENSLSNDEQKVVARMKGLITARRCALDHSEHNIEPYAKNSWLRTIVNSANCMSLYTDKAAKELYRNCRQELFGEIKNIKVLNKKNKICALLIIFVPNIHRWLYRLYKGK